jgi:hypothetical protein
VARRGWDDRWQYYPASKPLPADGIATSKQRGAMADSWWSERFVAMLASYGLGGRMQRGRRYARTGQVLSVDVNPGMLVAQVQGSRRTPYAVTVRCAEPTPAQWAALDEALGAQVRFAAGLLAGEVPPELEDVCAEAGFSLFPTTWADLRATCSCPDWENPCKHIASVLYVFADQLDGDPWLLLEWHGRSRDDLLAFLGASTDDDPNGRDGLPVWWPLTPGRLPQVTGAFQPRLSPTPDPPDRVLARLGPLDVEAVGAQVDELLADAYAAIIADPPTGTPG